MIKKYSVLITIIISLTFIVIATLLYPGGTISDKNTVGFDWTKNFFSNLFLKNAINGEENTGSIWAYIGMFFHSLTEAIFFVHMSTKIPSKGSANLIKYLGLSNMVFVFLIVTPYHDLMIIISGTIFLLNMFYITVFIFKTKLNVLKISCVLCLLIFYYTLYLYGTGQWGLLAIMQKVTFFSSALLILGLEYFSKKEDFRLTAPSR